MDRKEELLQVFRQIEDKNIIIPLIDDVVFLEKQLRDLRKLPFLRVNPMDQTLQKATPAAKQILAGILRKDSAEEESPLRSYIESRKKEMS